MEKRKAPKRWENHKWDPDDMRKAIVAVTSGSMSVRASAKTFHIPRTTLQLRLSGRYDVKTKLGRPSKLSSLDEKKLLDYTQKRASMGIGFGKKQFMKYSGDLAKKRNTPFKKGSPSEKWFRLYKRRNPTLVRRKPEGTASIRHEKMEKQQVACYFTALKEQLDKHNFHIHPERVWNMDETGWQFSHNPSAILAQKGSKHIHKRTSGNKETITIIATINAAGRVLPPHVIAKGKTRRTLDGFDVLAAPKDTCMSVSDKGWTKQGIAQLWFTQNFLPNIGKDRPQLLIMDGHDSHNFVELIDIALKEEIIFIELPSHTSNWLQPLDRSVFSPFKQYFNQACDTFMEESVLNVMKHSNFFSLFTKAWEKAMSTANIQSGFRACGILPFNPNAIPAEAYIPNQLYQHEVDGRPESTEEEVGLINSLPESVALEPRSAVIQELEQLTETLQHETEVHISSSEKKSDDLGLVNILEHPNHVKNRGDGLRSEEVAFLLLQDGDDVELRDEDDWQTIEDIPSTEHTPSKADYSSEDENVGSPGLFLSAIECALEPDMLQHFKRCYQKGIVAKDRLYVTWKKYTDIIKAKEQEEESQLLIINPQISKSPKRPVLQEVHENRTTISIGLDDDSDILPFPTMIRKNNAKTSKKLNPTYFVLTSDEVYQAKLKAVEDKKKKLLEKEARALERERKRQERELLKAEKEKKKAAKENSAPKKSKAKPKTSRK